MSWGSCCGGGSSLRGLCASLQELWRWSLCLLHAAWPGLCNDPCWASAVRWYKECFAALEHLGSLFASQPSEPTPIVLTAYGRYSSLKEVENRFSARHVAAGFMNRRYLLCIKRRKIACMEQVQKPRGWCGLHEQLSGMSQTLSLMFSFLLRLWATKYSVFEMLSLLCHPCVSQALFFFHWENYYY